MTKKTSSGAREHQPHQDDAVGYCRPPKQTRFKPGQSGNPRGRPRKKLALNEILEEAATTPVQVTVDGRVRRMPALKAIMMLEVRKALQGDGKASRFVLETFEARGLGGPVSGSQNDLASRAAGARERLAQKVEAALKDANSLSPINRPQANELDSDGADQRTHFEALDRRSGIASTYAIRPSQRCGRNSPKVVVPGHLIGSSQAPLQRCKLQVWLD